MEENVIDYTKLMRKSTRDVHSISDALINTKLALTSSNNTVWAEGLLIFYEVFGFIEDAIKKTENEHLKRFDLPEVFRKQAFEADLSFYLGPDWKKGYVPRQSVRRYLNYLGKLERNEPELLIAYFYHLYMGLLSGGQILRKKRVLVNKIGLGNSEVGGNAVTEFEVPIAELKQCIRKLVNEVCAEIEPEMLEKVIKEGQMVFRLNNEIVGSIEATNLVLFKRVFVVGSIVVLSWILYKILIK